MKWLMLEDQESHVLHLYKSLVLARKRDTSVCSSNDAISQDLEAEEDYDPS